MDRQHEASDKRLEEVGGGRKDREEAERREEAKRREEKSRIGRRAERKERRERRNEGKRGGLLNGKKP